MKSFEFKLSNGRHFLFSRRMSSFNIYNEQADIVVRELVCQT